MIRWWVALWDRREAPTVLALIRIGVGLVLLGEFITIWGFELIDGLFTSTDVGGLSRAHASAHPPWWMQWLGTGPAAARALVGSLILACVCLTAGVATRVSALVVLLLYAQTAAILPLSDRAIDMLLRNVLLILVFARSGDAWSVDARLHSGRWAGSPDEVPAWPRHLIVLQLVVVYFTAGVQKFAQPWWPWGDLSALYLILNDWSYARMDFSWLAWGPLYRLTQLATGITVVFQITYPMVLPHYFPPSFEPGRLRRAMERRQLHWLWIGVGAVFHLGIGLTMSLGIFAWGMLALYPAFVHPQELGALRARVRDFVRRGLRAPEPETFPRSDRGSDRRAAGPEGPTS